MDNQNNGYDPNGYEQNNYNNYNSNQSPDPYYRPQPQYGNNVKAILSLIFSIISVLCCCFWYVAIIFGVASVVFGVLAVRGNNPRQKDLGIAGIVVGSVGTVLAIAVAVLYIVLYSQSATEGITNTVSSISSLI
ncbi:MAG: DUF4190 domain-containing protein [Eubacterium sp.]|nr:DUF4190 domain-containing protein [Eubacterium sp.]